MKTNDKILIDNVALNIAGTASVESDVLDLTHVFTFCTFVKWTKTGGTVAGTIVPYKSADGVNWIALTTTNLTDGNGSVHTDYAEVAYPYYKVIATLTNGQATIYGSSFTKGA